MSEILQRAQLLMSQGRPELAEKDLRRALADDPDSGICHALLALCLTSMERHADATKAAQEAIHLDPDDSFAHYALSQVMYQRNRFDEALRSIQTAIRIDPYDADYFGVQAAIYYDQSNWKDASASAKHGLEVDPEHVRCLNIRSLSLTNLGRRDEAGRGLAVALEREPDNAHSHCSLGFLKLHEGDPNQALVHFREALRLDPNSDAARFGVVESMKARNIIYRWLLSWFLWMNTFSPRTQLFLVLGIAFGQGIVASVAESVPVLEPLVPFIIFGYLGFVWMCWCGPMLFNLVLRWDSFGRLALTDEQRLESTIAGVYLLVAVAIATALSVTLDWEAAILAAPFAVALIPLNGTFAAKGTGMFWPLAGVTLVATAMACAAVAGVFEVVTMSAEDIVKYLRYSLMISLYSTWASLFLIRRQTPKKI